VEQRGHVFDTAVRLRDMVPNHIFHSHFADRHGTARFVSTRLCGRDDQAKTCVPLAPMTDEDRALALHCPRQYGDGIVRGSQVQAYRSDRCLRPSHAPKLSVAMKP